MASEEVGKEIELNEDGVKKQILTEGTGDIPVDGNEVTVHYTGTLLDGTQFDSSRDKEDAFSFTLGGNQVIKGWDVGVATMRKGERCILTCPPKYAYGSRGAPPRIPANATLKFDVELLNFHHKVDNRLPSTNTKVMTHSSLPTGKRRRACTLRHLVIWTWRKATP
eukprot:Platyproteum_vivax@DN14048_c0_g1_i1.p1